MSSAIDNPIEEVKSAGIERLKNPFYFSLIVAFAVTNWKAIYILLWPSGSLDAEDRINAIQQLYEPWFLWYLIKVIVLPIGFACLYVAVFPKYLMMLDRARRRLQVDDENQRAEINLGLRDTRTIINQLTADVKKKDGEFSDLMINYKNILDKCNQLESDRLNITRDIIEHYPDLHQMVIELKADRSIRYMDVMDKHALSLLGVLGTYNEMEASFTEFGKKVALRVTGKPHTSK